MKTPRLSLTIFLINLYKFYSAIAVEVFNKACKTIPIPYRGTVSTVKAGLANSSLKAITFHI